MLERFVHAANAHISMLVTLSGIAILVRFSQYVNAYSPMLVTLLGIIIFLRLIHFANAKFPICLVFPMINLVPPCKFAVLVITQYGEVVSVA